MKVKHHSILSYALDGDGWLAALLVHFNPEEIDPGWWLGPRLGAITF